jgi:phosphatidylglycerol lysyltransferase
MKKPSFVVWLASAMTLGSGIINIISVIGQHRRQPNWFLREVFPLEFLHISRFLALFIGFVLIVSSINIYKRKKRAFQLVLILAVLSIIFHLTKGLDYAEAVFSFLLFLSLLATRKRFTVKSSIPALRQGVVLFLTAALVALSYGVFGFWLLDKRQFGVEFTFPESIRQTLLFLSMSSDPRLVPHTRYAHWFLRSLSFITVVAILYALYALFRPIIYIFRTLPHERLQAKDLIEKYGRSSLDFFKFWPDKSFFFSPSQNSFLAYRVQGNVALVLADPVGPEEEIEDITRSFRELCEENSWAIAFHQTLPDFLPVYRKLGFKKLKIGDEAIVDLNEFSLEGKKMKHLRHYLNQFEKTGISTAYYESPVRDDVLAQVKDVSDDWLKIAGRRERGFTQGVFINHYVQSTPVFLVKGQGGKALAFVNVIPSYTTGETTIDLMRHRTEAPVGIMDYLFTKLFDFQKERGFRRFSLGLAPMSGFQEKEEASAEERAVHYFIQRLNFLFSYKGLLQYKKKFASIWEPRYIIYRNVFDLPRVAIALNNASALKKEEYLHE